MLDSRALAQEFGNFIPALFDQEPPGWFVTVTHADQNYGEARSIAVRKKWLNELNGRFWGANYNREGLGFPSLSAIEYQARGTVHQHILIFGERLRDSRYIEWKRRLDHLAHGFSWIEIPRDLTGCSSYLGKYVAKGGQLDIWLPRSMMAFKLRAEKYSASLC
jgi:hypothetical protein